MSMTTKFGRMVTYLDGLQHIKSHDSLITRYCDNVWHTKTAVHLATEFGRMVT